MDQAAQKGSLLIFLSILFYPSGRASSRRIVAVIAFQANAENDKSWSIGHINSFGKRSFQCTAANKWTNTDFFIRRFLWSFRRILDMNDIYFYDISHAPTNIRVYVFHQKVDLELQISAVAFHASSSWISTVFCSCILRDIPPLRSLFWIMKTRPNLTGHSKERNCLLMFGIFHFYRKYEAPNGGSSWINIFQSELRNAFKF